MEHTNYTIEKLQKMPTVKLLDLLNSVRAQISISSQHADSDCVVSKVISEVCVQPFQKFASQLKEVLSTREHIPNKQERQKIRQQKQREKQSR